MKLIIKDDDGKVTHEVETNCILAAVAETGKDRVKTIGTTKANASTIVASLLALDDVKEELFKKEPILPLLYAMKNSIGLEDEENETADD